MENSIDFKLPIYYIESKNKLDDSIIDDLELVKSKDNSGVNQSLNNCLSSMKSINERRQIMWQASRWKHYNDFRVFIMGIKGNDEIFGDGVIYEGISEEPVQYRGQTGAQDNIIPTADIFTGVIDYYPSNDLTKYLLDLRSYRPKCIQNFLSDLKDEMKENRLFNSISRRNRLEPNRTGLVCWNGLGL